MARNQKKTEKGTNQRNDDILANAAMFYYKEGLTQNEIGKRMGVSRATVVNYLRLARDYNIVDIRINGASFSSSNLSKELRGKFGLKDAYVADFSPGHDTKPELSAVEMNRHVARVGASALHDIVKPGDILGVAWGETIHFLADELPRKDIERVTVCQMIGSMKTPLLSAAETCAIRISSRMGAECYILHAPAILSTAQFAEALRNEPVIKSQLEHFAKFSRTLFSVGTCDSQTHAVQSAIASKQDVDWYKSQGAVGVLCGRFIDRDGNHIQGDMDTRIVGITLDVLRRQKAGILVAGGRRKLEAVRATLAGGYVSHLVVDETTARDLIGR